MKRIFILILAILFMTGCSQGSDSVAGPSNQVTVNGNLPFVLCEDIWSFTVEAGAFTATVVPASPLDVRLVMFGMWSREYFYVDSNGRGGSEIGTAVITDRETLHIQVGSVHETGSYDLILSSDGPISDVKLVYDDTVCHYAPG
ncbi:MAG: membrane lipoprotein lipid attachment site-containing protein [Nitrospirae bacterium]|nr:membrane lipoprotein lipid attachment site-containing protein [Nitrospirota bacterium]